MMIKVNDKIRIVAAVIHQDDNEVEIIIEKTTNVGSLNDEKDTLVSIWIDCETDNEEKDSIIKSLKIANKEKDRVLKKLISDDVDKKMEIKR
ncbi:hypothetical protein KA005_07455 [bacterium]|nr:hypothetical protein [bacterium]